jgi:hypothetical protein
MDPIARFHEYAAAFEDVVQNDDWSLLEPFFSEDAVYEILGGEPFAGRHEGRDAVLAHLKRSLDGFDRRFESRRIEFLEGPVLREGSVWFRWRVGYQSPGLPELVLDGEEVVTFEEERIRRLEDRFPPQMSHITEGWFRAYGERLPPLGD